MLGAAETVVGLTNVFRLVAEWHGVYQPNKVRNAPVRMPTFGASASKVAAMAGI
jgi:chemotaxis protein methyltransferase CheR